MPAFCPTMSSNFDPSNSFSPVGLLGPGNESISDFRIFHSSTDQTSSSLDHMMWEGASGLNFDSNLGDTQLGSLFSHRVTEVTRAFLSPLRLGSVEQQLFHSAIDHICLQNRPAAFPLSDHITVSSEVVDTTCFVASSSTMDRIFGYRKTVRNQATFPTNRFAIQGQPAAVRNHYNQIVHPFLSESTPSENQVTPSFLSESTPPMNQVIRHFLSQSAPSMNQVTNSFLTESPPSLINQEVFNYVSDPATVPGNQNIETVFDAAPVYPAELPTSHPLVPLAVNLQNPNHNLNNSNYNMNESHVKPIRELRIVELSDDENVLDHSIVPGNANGETVFNHAPVYPSEQPNSHPLTPLTVNLQNPAHNLYNSHYNMNHRNMKPIGQVRIVDLSDDENNAAEYPLGNDGRIHSLLNPDGTYGCPICSASCDSAQTFGSHIQLHYQMDESVEERNRRMAAKCRHKKLRLVETSQGVTAVPAHDYLPSKRRKNKGKEKIDVNSENLQRLGPLNTSAGAAAKKRPVGVVLKEEAM